MKRKPNILFFFTDQQRADTCGCHGASLGLTPCLDQLAKEGVAFDNAITCQPVCGPARAVIQTGKYATKNGCYRNMIALEDNGKTLAHQLADHGYSTNYIGKWHLAGTELDPVPMEKRCGYKDQWIAADLLEFTSDAYEGFFFDRENRRIDFKDRYRPDLLTDYAVDFIKEYDREEPFYLMMSFLEPHHQNHRHRYVAPDGYADKLRDLPAPKDLVELDKQDADWRQNLADYYGCIKRLDENLQRVVDALKEKGIYEDTVILFTSDHGSHFRTRNGEYKRSCHEASVHIPMVIRGGEYIGGKAVKKAVSLVDLAPTILEIAGVPADPDMDGRGAACLVRADDEDWDENILIQISESQVARALRTPRYKYCITAPHKDGWRDESSEVYTEECLYDLEKDPFELHNVVVDPDYELIKIELREKLLEKIEASGEKRPRVSPLSCYESVRRDI